MLKRLTDERRWFDWQLGRPRGTMDEVAEKQSHDDRKVKFFRLQESLGKVLGQIEGEH
jgi:hypothetical protein